MFLFASVASISLFVGGIGIMNIILMSVTERTREILLRMAMGARRLHLRWQLLAKAVFMSVMGGVAGIVIASKIISFATGWNAPISLIAVGTGFVYSAAVGIFFGFYPARKVAYFDAISIAIQTIAPTPQHAQRLLLQPNSRLGHQGKRDGRPVGQYLAAGVEWRVHKDIGSAKAQSITHDRTKKLM